jgi:hypothetical protein
MGQQPLSPILTQEKQSSHHKFADMTLATAAEPTGSKHLLNIESPAASVSDLSPVHGETQKDLRNVVAPIRIEPKVITVVPSRKQLNGKELGSQDIAEFSTAFSTRPKLSRTPE